MHFSRKSENIDRSCALVFSMPKVSRSRFRIGLVGTYGIGIGLTANWPYRSVYICCDILKSSKRNWFVAKLKCLSENFPRRIILPEILPLASMCSLSKWLFERPGNMNLPVNSSNSVQPALQMSTAESRECSRG